MPLSNKRVSKRFEYILRKCRPAMAAPHNFCPLAMKQNEPVALFGQNWNRLKLQTTQNMQTRTDLSELKKKIYIFNFNPGPSWSFVKNIAFVPKPRSFWIWVIYTPERCVGGQPYFLVEKVFLRNTLIATLWGTLVNNNPNWQSCTMDRTLQNSNAKTAELEQGRRSRSRE